MARTLIGVNDPKAIRKQSAGLAVEVVKDAYFGTRFFGQGEKTQMPIMQKNDLEREAGDKIDYQLSMSLIMEPVEGEDPLSGNEEDLVFQNAQVFIDDMRQGVDLGGRVTRKRTIFNLREVARSRSTEWWARIWDEVIFAYLSGARGINESFLLRPSWTGRAGNPLRAPDQYHHIFAGAATSKATLTTADVATLKLVDFVCTKAKLMGGGTQRIPRISPIRIEGAKHFVFLMDEWSAYTMRNSTGSNEWLEIQKAAAGALGKNSPIFKGSLGMYNKVVMHQHENVIRFDDGGAGADVEYARCLFLGRQAGTIAFGNAGGGNRFDWTEEVTDHKAHVAIGTNCMWGFRKNRYAATLDDSNGIDFGVYAVDAASTEPASAL